MRKIRRSLFETNSSSSHSIEINPTGMKDDSLDAPTIYLGSGGYGWGYEKLTCAFDKADYCAVRFLIEEDEEALDILRDLIFEQTGQEVEYEREDRGYIDHQSMDEYIPRDHQGLYNLIFDKGSYIIIDNDNH